MTRNLILALMTVLIAGTASAQMPQEVQDPDINSINRNPARAYAMPLASVSAALNDALEPETPYVQSLNGDWKISWSGDPSRRVKDFYKTK